MWPGVKTRLQVTFWDWLPPYCSLFWKLITGVPGLWPISHLIVVFLFKWTIGFNLIISFTVSDSLWNRFVLYTSTTQQMVFGSHLPVKPHAGSCWCWYGCRLANKFEEGREQQPSCPSETNNCQEQKRSGIVKWGKQAAEKQKSYRESRDRCLGVKRDEGEVVWVGPTSERTTLRWNIDCETPKRFETIVDFERCKDAKGAGVCLKLGNPSRAAENTDYHTVIP